MKQDSYIESTMDKPTNAKYSCAFLIILLDLPIII